MPAKGDNIYLVGYRCTGKTTVGHILAGRLGRTFYDTDTEIVAGENRSITQIVADRGWSYFRKLEEKCLQHLAGQTTLVVATGGGIVLNPANIKRMQSSGTVIWLTARPETIQARLSRDPATADSRPALTDQSEDREVVATLEARQGLYDQAANFTLATDTAGPNEIAADILNLI